ncbi:LuxR C-terminal-related transcriptional regulator [Marinimicrobium sp. ABcell2]|uniref:helix-turn-helix transcriptional regulator n=1 Tax=Marinimicrobium sp. ABcell2 TaxID=3069751 RepID=UPI0027B630B1|nr:LuxR C-terminal-related transcriptional regulator [Marinimicrobium sp. ABcell2]MDQ2076863.1 LuxR C-terminal-related transcriptional regulator [Marinimicrobium sp. ABcell2]
MKINEERWLAVVDQFHAAAMGESGWVDSLSALALATGSRAGELIGLGSAHTIPFHWFSGLEQEWFDDFLAYDGGNPAVNPFIRVGSQCAPLQVRSSEEFVTKEERRSNPFLTEHLARFDAPYICLTPLVKDPGSLVGLAVIRSSSDGEITPEQRAIFTSIAPHVRSAVRAQTILENQGAQLMAGTLEALSMAVFVCDSSGRVRSLTPNAEILVGRSGPLRLKGGTLTTSNQVDTRALADAIRAAGRELRPGAPHSATVLVRGLNGEPTVLEVIAVPRRENAFSFEPRVLVVAKGSATETSSVKLLLKAAYGLTDAEALVALALADGLAPEQIAAQRSAAISTVRKQIASVYEKLGVHRQIELIAHIHRLR